jgi:hypothetical protein
MLFIQAAEITPALTTLFDLNEPTIPRAWNVLEGSVRGRIMADDATHPSWAAVQDAVFGTLYCGGRVTHDVLASIVECFRQIGDVGIGCWPDSELNSMLPPDPDYDGRTLYFTERSDVPLAPPIARLPADYRLAIRDAALFPQSFDYESTLAAFGTVEQVLRLTYGVVALHEGVVCCEAASGAPTHGRIEIGVTTAETHRRRGLASSVCR